MTDYNYVITSGYQPLSMQEALTPFVMYKDAYEKAEDKYEELSQKVGDFQYLADTLPEGSKARKIYEGYAKDYERYRDDFAKNGLNMISHNGLGTMRRRYAGEIGMLAKAQSALEKEQAIRREMSLKDPSMLYASNNFTIDDYLYGNTPNNYSISGDYLYSKGAQAGKFASSRIYSAGDKGSTLGGFFRDYVQTMGYSPETIAKFRQDASAIPELQEQAESILRASGVYGNLSDADLDRARAQVINGMIDGAVYTEQHSLQRDLGRMTASEEASNALGWANHNESVRQHNLQLRMSGYDENGVYHPESDSTLQRVVEVQKVKNSGKNGKSGSKSSTTEGTQSKNRTVFSWPVGNSTKFMNSNWTTRNATIEDTDSDSHVGPQYRFSDLPVWAQEQARIKIGNGKPGDYDYYFKPEDTGLFTFFPDGPKLEIVPRDIKSNRKDSSSEFEEIEAALSSLE